MEFEDMINKIILGDCMDYLKKILIGEINQKGVNFSSCELIYTNIPKNNVKKYFIRQIGFINDGDDRFHPTQKPYRLISEIIKDYSEENDLILDAFSGSGTVCCVAKDLKRKFIGFEINEKFYKKSIDRLNGIDSNGQYTIFAYENGENK